MDEDLQKEIDRIRWYHEFDFPNGLRARSKTADAEAHRQIWRFIERSLEAVDFRNKTVLEVGAWDGYWSFYAERRGASHVLASDDLTQNWSDGSGVHVAKRLLESAVEVRQDVSVYELASLGRKFDLILCFGVHYHLLDPFYAFAQIRHCCQQNTLVLLEGDVARCGMKADHARYTLTDPRLPAFVPSVTVLHALLEASYLRMQRQDWLKTSRFWRIRGLAHNLRHRRTLDATFVDRAFLVCSPFEGENRLHHYAPPFGLHLYDGRFR